MSGSRRPQIDRAPVAQRPQRSQEVTPAALEVLRGVLVVTGGQAQGPRGVVLSVALEPRRVLGVALAAGAAHECQEPLPDTRQRQLVRQHRSDADGGDSLGSLPGVTLEHPEQRQIRGCHRLQQPFLAERPSAEALHVGHVRVEQDAQLSPVAVHRHGRHTASRSSERSSGPPRSWKSRSLIAGTKRE